MPTSRSRARTATPQPRRTNGPPPGGARCQQKESPSAAGGALRFRSELRRADSAARNRHRRGPVLRRLRLHRFVKELRAQRDDLVETFRIGLGVRLPGKNVQALRLARFLVEAVRLLDVDDVIELGSDHEPPPPRAAIDVQAP